MLEYCGKSWRRFTFQKTGNNKLFLLKQLMTFEYKEGSPILDHINDFQGILDQLSGIVLILMMKYKDFGFLILYQILGNSLCFSNKFNHWWKGDYGICKEWCVE